MATKSTKAAEAMVANHEEAEMEETRQAASVNTLFDFNPELDLTAADEAEGSEDFPILPAGWYFTMPTDRFDTAVREKGIYKDRMTTRYWIQVTDHERTGYVDLEISPTNGTYNGKADRATLLRQQAVKAFHEANDALPASYTELVNFLATDSVALRLGIRKGNEGYRDRNTVYALKAAPGNVLQMGSGNAFE